MGIEKGNDLEIEKKFKVKKLPRELSQYKKKVIEQGYLCTNPIIRIRRSDEDYILTYKSVFGLEDKLKEKAKVCHELEVPLNREGYEHLQKKIDGILICKTRYFIPFKQGEEYFQAELDIFEGSLTGLVIVEVEFPNIEAAIRFKPLEWFGEDISNDKRYTNHYLATRGWDRNEDIG